MVPINKLAIVYTHTKQECNFQDVQRTERNNVLDATVLRNDTSFTIHASSLGMTTGIFRRRAGHPQEDFLNIPALVIGLDHPFEFCDPSHPRVDSSRPFKQVIRSASGPRAIST